MKYLRKKGVVGFTIAAALAISLIIFTIVVYHFILSGLQQAENKEIITVVELKQELDYSHYVLDFLQSLITTEAIPVTDFIARVLPQRNEHDIDYLKKLGAQLFDRTDKYYKIVIRNYQGEISLSRENWAGYTWTTPVTVDTSYLTYEGEEIFVTATFYDGCDLSINPNCLAYANQRGYGYV